MVICDRCKAELPKHESGSMTAGYYKNWPLMMDADEHILCDDCAFADPRYIAVYGDHR